MGRNVPHQSSGQPREGETHLNGGYNNRKALRKKKREEKKQRRGHTLNTWTKKNVENKRPSQSTKNDICAPNKNTKLKYPTFIPHFNENELKLVTGATHGSTQFDISKTQDDALLEYLDQKLDINGDPNRKRKLEKDIGNELFGSKSGFLGLLDDILDDTSGGNKTYPSSDEDIQDDGTNDQASADESIDEDIDEDNDEPVDEDIDEDIDDLPSGKTGSIIGSAKAGIPSKAGTPSKASKASTQLAKSSTPASNKYIPPSLRNAVSESSGVRPSENKDLDLKTCVKSMFNRVSEANLNLLLQDFMAAVRSGREKLELSSMGVLTTAEIEENSKKWINNLCETIADEAIAYIDLKSGTNLLAPQTAMVCALSGLISSKIGWLFSARLFHLYAETSVELYSAEKSDTTAKDEAVPVFQVPLDLLNTCRQAITAISLLFYFGTLSATLLTAFFHILLHDGEFVMNVRRAEFLSIILRLAGPTLQQDYADHFLQMKDEITTLLSNASTMDESHAHIDYLKHELENMNKLIHTPMYEKFLAMRKWLHSSSHTNPLSSVNWNLIQVDTPYGDGQEVIRDLMCNRLPQISDGIDSTMNSMNNLRSSNSSQLTMLLEKAKLMGIKTPLQQQIFVAVMGAESVESGVVRILRTCQKKKQMPLSVSVILHCAIYEREYNEFYEQLLVSLCENSDKRASTRFKTAVRQALHSEVNSLLHDYEGSSTTKHQHRKEVVSKLITVLSSRECISKASILLRKLEGHESDEDLGSDESNDNYVDSD